jgi:hypothetical protein
MFTI